jgi:hypothetical protein
MVRAAIDSVSAYKIKIQDRLKALFFLYSCVQNLNVIKYNELKIEAIEP